MAIEKTIIIRTDTTKAVKSVDKLNDSVKETNKDVKQTSESTKVLGGELDKATNGAIGKFKGLVSVVKTTIKGFKGLQVACLNGKCIKQTSKMLPTTIPKSMKKKEANSMLEEVLLKLNIFDLLLVMQSLLHR